MMSKSLRWTAAVLMMVGAGKVAAQQVTHLGQNWSDADRTAFYTTSIGSQIMPQAWFWALERADSDESFIGDSLRRYGFLAYDGNPDKLPLGFTIDRDRLGVWVGFGCAACHTGEIRYDGRAIRVDGAPAQADIQGFLVDLADALDATVDSRFGAKFARFSDIALRRGGEEATPEAADRLFRQASAFAQRWRQRVARGERELVWGHGRADGQARLVTEFRREGMTPAGAPPASAPVNFPHLWGTSAQSHGQWTGEAPTGTPLARLARNSGEAMAFMGKVAVSTDRPYFPSTLRRFNMLRLERPLERLWSPQWREDLLGAIDWSAAEKGETLYMKHCVSCHAIVPHGPLPAVIGTVLEPVATSAGGGVGTDPVRARSACAGRFDTGPLQGFVLAGTAFPFPPEMAIPALADRIVEGALLSPLTYGSMESAASLFRPDERDAAALAAGLDRLDERDAGDGPLFDDLDVLAGRLDAEVIGQRAEPGDCGIDSPMMRYKARPLDGIWATAPYLHNGSVASLHELLLPAPARMKVFHIGSMDFDPAKVGFDPSPAPGTTLLDTSLPGNSNAGHDTYGNYSFSEDDRRALIEYLKTL